VVVLHLQPPPPPTDLLGSLGAVWEWVEELGKGFLAGDGEAAAGQRDGLAVALCSLMVMGDDSDNSVISFFLLTV
jgi:hypothetical protein